MSSDLFMVEGGGLFPAQPDIFRVTNKYSNIFFTTIVIAFHCYGKIVWKNSVWEVRLIWSYGF